MEESSSILAEGEKYPRRILPAGFVLIVAQSIANGCHLSKIKFMQSKIGKEAYNDIREHCQLGVILKLVDAGFKFGGKYMKYLFANMLETSMKHELWVLVDGRPLRFSLYEFEDITCMKCHLEEGEYDLSDVANVGNRDLCEEMRLNNPVGQNWKSITNLLAECSSWNTEKKKMVGLLVILHAAIFGLHHNSKVFPMYAKLVTDPERCEGFPWGRVTFRALISSIPKPSLTSSTINLHGVTPPLAVWTYHHIPRLGSLCGGERPGAVPLLQWLGCCTRNWKIEEVFDDDKKTSSDHKVIVYKE